jgi:hypothetical protein
MSTPIIVQNLTGFFEIRHKLAPVIVVNLCAVNKHDRGILIA